MFHTTKPILSLGKLWFLRQNIDFSVQTQAWIPVPLIFGYMNLTPFLFLEIHKILPASKIFVFVFFLILYIANLIFFPSKEKLFSGMIPGQQILVCHCVHRKLIGKHSWELYPWKIKEAGLDRARSWAAVQIQHRLSPSYRKPGAGMGLHNCWIEARGPTSKVI